MSNNTIMTNRIRERTLRDRFASFFQLRVYRFHIEEEKEEEEISLIDLWGYTEEQGWERGNFIEWKSDGGVDWIYVCGVRYEYLLFHVTKNFGAYRDSPIFRHCVARGDDDKTAFVDHTSPRGGMANALMKLSRNSTGWLPATRFTFDLNARNGAPSFLAEYFYSVSLFPWLTVQFSYRLRTFTRTMSTRSARRF